MYMPVHPAAFLYAFDLIELNGDDLRRDPLEVRKATLASVLAKAGPGLRFNEHLEADAPSVRARLQDAPRRHRVATEELALPQRPLARLAQVQKPGRTGGET